MALDTRSLASAMSGSLPSNGNRHSGQKTADAGVTRASLARVIQFTDCLIAVSVLCTVWIAVHHEQAVSGIDSLLAMSISVKNLGLLGLFLVVWVRVCSALGLYHINRHTRAGSAIRIVAASLIGSLFVIPFALTSHDGEFDFNAVFAFWPLSAIAMIVSRSVVHSLVKYVTTTTSHPRHILVVGSGPRAFHFYQALSQHRAVEHTLVGFVDNIQPGRRIEPEIERRLTGGLDELEAILFKQVIDEVFIALPVRSCYADIERAIAICERSGVAVKYPVDIFQPSLAKSQFEPSYLPTISLKFVLDSRKLVVKRAIDVCGALTGLVLFFPVMIVVAALIKATSRGPVFFKQERYGFNKRRFPMFKFRTMEVDAEARLKEIEHLNELAGPIFKIKNDPRVTGVGKFLRKSSLDELPQLINVLRGEMSLVGPRPMSVRDVLLFDDPRFMQRFAVRPGLTCLWQIGGRSNTDFNYWLDCDMRYINNWSLLLDISILLKTVPAVLKGSGAV